MDDGVFDLLLARGNEADFQCLRFDDHARDVAFDQLAIRGSRRGLEDRFMLAAMHLAPIGNLADVEPVLEQMGKRSHAEADTASRA